MKQNKLSILFLLKKNRINSRGTCPICCRITYLRRRKQFSTGEFIKPADWISKSQEAGSEHISNQQINFQLEIITANIRKTYLKLQLADSAFSVDDLYDNFIGKPSKKEYGVIQYFKEFLEKKERLIGIDIQRITWKKFEYVFKDLRAFIKSKYGKRDYPLIKLNQSFLDDFEYYLKTSNNQRQVTVNKAIQRLRKPIRVAVAEGYIPRDPFALHKPGRVRKEVIFFSTDELKLLEDHAFIQPRLAIVKDLFVFCCYTGLAYHEMSNLKKEHIVKGFDGNQWIQMKRKKTDRIISVPLLPKAKMILDKYYDTGDYALPKYSNQKINSYLKEIGGIVGIKKSISHHMARKTFASTVLLYNDVPMEIVSELLGHSSIKMTQEYYGKVVQRKVGAEMVRLSRKLG